MSDPQLSAEQLHALSGARDRARPFVRASKVAAFNGWTIGTLGALTLVFGFRSPVGLILGIGMLVVGRNELRGGKGIRAFDSKAPSFLGWNQVGFMSLIIAYCLWSLILTYVRPEPMERELLDILGLDPDVVRGAVAAVYVVVLFLAAVVQGLNSRYYFRRGPMMREYLEGTPDWIVELLRATSGD